MAGCIRDILHSARSLVKARTFTAVCVTSLGLGMSVVIGILLFTRAFLGTPPGVAAAGLVELVVRPSGELRAQAGEEIIDTWSYADYLDVRAAASGMAITGWSRGDAMFRPAAEGAPVPLPAMYVSSNYFSTIGVPLLRGAGFSPFDDAAEAEPEAVIGYRTWQVRFAGDPNIIGRRITVNQSEYVVTGVTTEGFRGHFSDLDGPYYQVWLPLSRHPRLAATATARLDRNASWVGVIARLSPETTVEQADATVRSLMAALAVRYPASNQDKAGAVEPYFPTGASMRSEVSYARTLMFGIAGMVLLIVGLNVSGMMLVRGATRERELAIRLAMGANRWRLMRYHFAEALVVAVFAGALGSAFLFGGPVFLARAFDLIGPTGVDAFRPDAWVVLQIIALCFVTSLVLGLLPALRFSRPAITTVLKNATGSGRRVGRLQRFTAAAQAGLAVPFLVMCGVQLDQARVTAFADLGFAPRGLYAAPLNLSAVAATDEERQRFAQTLRQNLAVAPGLVSVSVADGVPLDFNYRDTRVARDGDSRFVQAHTTRIAPGYLDTVGIRVLSGRSIDETDRDGAERAVMLSLPLARQLFGESDALGERVVFALPGGEQRAYTVVGVTADVVSTQMGNPRPQLFVSLAQHPASTVLAIARGQAGDPSMRAALENAIAATLRQTSGQANPDVVFRELMTGEGLVEISRSDFLTSAAVGGVAAAVALALSALGVYGVIAFMVATRTREIGVRVALGASRARVLRDVLGGALTLVVPGIGVGLMLAVLWVRFTDAAWYPLGGVEPLAYSLAAAAAFAVAVLAGIPSARRAAAIQPIVAMKSE